MLVAKLEKFVSKKDNKEYIVLNVYYELDNVQVKVCSYFLKDMDRVALKDLIAQI